MLEADKKKKNENYTEREKEVLQIYKKLNTTNQHKMKPIPVCLIPIEIKYC
jgi:NAD+ synthase